MDAAKLTATFFTVRLFQSVQQLPSRFCRELNNCIWSAPLASGMSRHGGGAACGRKRAENSVKSLRIDLQLFGNFHSRGGLP